ncbi:MAG: TetR/AcrR family transcriptional regulator, partial [Anaerotignum sp.]
LQEGYDSLSMRKISDAIGYSPTTLYIYYKNKAEIVQDLSISLYENMMETVQAHLKEYADLSIPEQLTAVYKLFVQSMIAQEKTGDALRGSPVNSAATLLLIQQRKNNGLELVQDLLRQGEAQGFFTGITEDTPWMLQVSLIGFTSYITAGHLYQKEGWETLLDQYIGMLLKSISP